MIRDHFNKIDQSDAILVVNFEKKGIKNYIGGSCLIEMGKAFDKNIPIFILNDIPEISYREEIKAMKTIVIHSELNKIPSRQNKSTPFTKKKKIKY